MEKNNFCIKKLYVMLLSCFLLSGLQLSGQDQIQSCNVMFEYVTPLTMEQMDTLTDFSHLEVNVKVILGTESLTSTDHIHILMSENGQNLFDNVFKTDGTSTPQGSTIEVDGDVVYLLLGTYQNITTISLLAELKDAQNNVLDASTYQN